MEFLVVTPVVLVVLAVLGFFIFVAYRRAWRIPPPNEALIIVGKSRGSDSGAVVAQERIDGSDQTAAEAIEEDRLEGLDFRIATSATWVNPLTSRTFPLGLNSRSTTFTADGHDKDKVAVSVRGVLLYKVADNYDAIARAARRFLDVDDDSMNKYIEQLITGQVRALVGAMSVEQLITDRQTLMDRVREATAQDMAVLGLKIDSLTIQEVADNQGYIENLGRPQAETVARQASIAADQARHELIRSAFTLGALLSAGGVAAVGIGRIHAAPRRNPPRRSPQDRHDRGNDPRPRGQISLLVRTVAAADGDPREGIE